MRSDELQQWRPEVYCVHREVGVSKTGPITPYKFRWWLLGTVVLLNLANYAHWIAFPAVAKKVTTYKISL